MRTLSTLGVAVGLAAVAFASAGSDELDGYRSSCACESPREGFIQLLGISPRDLGNPQKVGERFAHLFPPGASAAKVKDFLDGDCEVFANPRLLICKYIYEENEVHRRGYSVIYSLDDSDKVIGLRAVRAYKPLKKLG